MPKALLPLIQVLLVAYGTLAGQEILMPPFVLTELIGLNLEMQERCLFCSPSKTSDHELGMSWRLSGLVCKCRILIWTEKWFHIFSNSFHDCLMRLDATENLSQNPLWRVVEFPPQHGVLLRYHLDWDQRLKYFENKELNYSNFFFFFFSPLMWGKFTIVTRHKPSCSHTETWNSTGLLPSWGLSLVW